MFNIYLGGHSLLWSKYTFILIVIVKERFSCISKVENSFEGLFTPDGRESEKYQRTVKMIKEGNEKHQRKFSLTFSLSLNGP